MKNIVVAFIILFFWSCKNKTNPKTKTVEKIETASNEQIKLDKTKTKTITFPSLDGLTITADIYKLENKPITMLLCHQAGFSRGEYMHTALELNALGYSVMAIDQRSGNECNGVVNETAKRAKEVNLPTAYLNARQDIEAAIDYIFSDNGNNRIILVGSSYSATLALLIANENDKIKAVGSFSPGEYFEGMNIQQKIKGLNIPLYVTSSKKETNALGVLVSEIKKDDLIFYKPLEKGVHGSRALWDTTKGSNGYWASFKSFLNTLD